MNALNISSTLRAALMLAVTGLVSNSGSALAAELPYDAQAQIQAPRSARSCAVAWSSSRCSPR